MEDEGLGYVGFLMPEYHNRSYNSKATYLHPKSKAQHPYRHFVTTDRACMAMSKTLHLALSTTTPAFPKDHPTLPTHPSHLDDPCLPKAYLALAKFLLLDSHQLEILNGEHAYKAIHPDTGRDVEHPELLRSSDGLLWEESCAEEAGRLAQGYKQAKDTNTINFIHHDQIPKGRRATYLRNIVAAVPKRNNLVVSAGLSVAT